MKRIDSRRLRLVSLMLALALCAGMAQAARAGDVPSSARWKPGVNFTVLSPAQPTNAPAGKVQVMEFFYLACPYCHALEPYLTAWRKHLPGYVQFVRTPVMWGPIQVADAQLYYSLEAAGRGDLVDTAFNTLHRLENAAGGDENVMMGSSRSKTFALQVAFAERHGLSAAAYGNAFNSFDVHVEMDRARELGKLYEVMHTPTIIVDGRYRTDPGKAGGNQQLIELINFLTRWDHEHPHAG